VTVTTPTLEVLAHVRARSSLGVPASFWVAAFWLPGETEPSVHLALGNDGLWKLASTAHHVQRAAAVRWN